jgi:uncharacterized protein (TIGR03083 family)
MVGGEQTDPDGSFDAAVYLDVLRVAGTNIVGLATVHGLNAPVPNCPGWTTMDLVAHLSWVYRWVAVTVRDARPDPPSRSERAALQDPDPVDDAGVVERLQRAHSTLVTTLSEAPVDLACWTAWPAASARDFWIRRQVFETLIHKVDAENAVHAVITGGEDLSAGLAADGVDEMVRGFSSRYSAHLRSSTPVTLAVHATDVGERWWIRISEAVPQSGRGVAPAGSSPHVEVHARAGELLLLLWNRRTAEDLDVRGDRGALDAWRRGAHL